MGPTSSNWPGPKADCSLVACSLQSKLIGGWVDLALVGLLQSRLSVLASSFSHWLLHDLDRPLIGATVGFVPSRLAETQHDRRRLAERGTAPTSAFTDWLVPNPGYPLVGELTEPHC